MIERPDRYGLGLIEVSCNLADPPDTFWGHAAPPGCVAIRIHGTDRHVDRMEVAAVPDPGDNETGWKCWAWFWARATPAEAQAALDRRAADIDRLEAWHAARMETCNDE